MILAYIFSIVTYIWFADQYSFFGIGNNVASANNLFHCCDSMSSCWLTMIDTSIKYGGAFGEYLESIGRGQDREHWNWGRFFYDYAGLLFVNIIM